MFHEIFWCIKNHLCRFIFNVFIKYLFVIVLLSGMQVLIESNAIRVLLLIKIFHFKIRHYGQNSKYQVVIKTVPAFMYSMFL